MNTNAAILADTVHVKNEQIAKLVEALEAADRYLNSFDTSKPSRIKAETRAIVAEALALSLMATTTLRKGARIETTGEGRTRTWKGWLGTVTHVRNGRIYARMDGTRFTEEEFEPNEARLYDPQPDCPCAICRHG